MSSVDSLTTDLGSFKVKVSTDLASMGLRMKKAERQNADVRTRVAAMHSKLHETSEQ